MIFQTIADAKLKSALKSEGDQEKVQEVIFLEVTKEKRKLQEDFDLKVSAPFYSPLFQWQIIIVSQTH